MYKLLEQTIKKITPLDKKSMQAMQAHHAQLLMPLGALSVPLSYVEQLAGIFTEKTARVLAKKRVVLFAADHGIAAEGVSAYPQEVTRQMLGSFANKWAVITALAKSQHMDVVVLDMGVKGEAIEAPTIRTEKLGEGTKNFLQEDAMSIAQLEKAVGVGIRMARETKAAGYDIALIGEMGIGNTTSASAISAVLLAVPVGGVTGHGTGVGEEAYRKKILLIEKALQNRKPDALDPLGVLQKVGGFEIAAMTGFLLGAAGCKLPVLLDGFITGSAALVASMVCLESKQYWIAGHVSKEQGHKKILEKLSLRPLLDLDLRLGEGSGAAFALPLLEQAIAVSRDTATFTTAQVSNKE
jgi:nicotinate-nucleotide--dimethylbenzimidazole phosphoribosyltransferase